jgi:hypothetical protein
MAISVGAGIPSLKGTFRAYDTDLVNKQFRAAKLVATSATLSLADKIVDFATAATDKLIGIIDNVPAAVEGADVEVIVLGEAKAKAGSGGWAAGDILVADANGDLVVATPANTTNNYSIGRALEAAAQYDIKRILVLPGIVQVA